MEFKLDDNFIKKYSKLEPAFGFNGLGKIVYLRTYSRIKEDGSNEKWYETIRRVVEGTYSIQKKHITTNGLGWDEKKGQESAEEMYDRMFNMKFLPPGRGLWAMGTNIIKDKNLFVALNNCFTGDTKYVTDKGIVTFNDTINTTVNVLTESAGYRPAKVNSFGKQKVFEYTFKPSEYRSNLEIKIKATKNHRWILSDASETINLKIGDKIPSNPQGWMNEELNFDLDIQNEQFRNGFTHGLIFGDGTRHTYYPNRHYIKICDGKELEYSKCLTKHPGFTTRTEGSDEYPVYTIISNENLKELPFNKNEEYIKGFIQGWISADGWQKSFGSICVDTQNDDFAEWLIENAIYANLVPTGHSYLYNDTNFGKRKNRLNRISLSPKHLLEYKVVDKKEVGKENVFCVTEPETGTFTLSSGLITGNCAFVSTEDIQKDLSKPFEFMMDFSMLGVGVGFDVKGASKLRILSPNKSITTYQIPDTREGWLESLKIALNSFFKGDSFPEFDYTLLRPKGALIRGFGGKASGPKPLRKLHEQIRELLTKRIDQLMSIQDIVDIMNLIGVCVISGNVRRTAQIVFGQPDNEEYLKLKDYHWDNTTQSFKGTKAERASHGWASNNSIFCNIGMDYTNVAKQTATNGEPGYAWLENMQHYGRMGENSFDDKFGKDIRVKGGNPCLEQSLESYEMCCLVETFPTKHTDKDDYLRTLKFAYLYAKTVTLGTTHWVETNRVQLRNRRIGTSVSGIAQFIDNNGLDTLKTWLEEGYSIIQYYDNVYSEWLAVPKSIKTTSIKPSGTVSLLPGVTPGMHYPESNYYIRRMRIAKNSELLSYIKQAGYKVELDINDSENTEVVEIPVAIENTRTISEISMWEQLSLASFLQEHWADNQVSCTVTFNKEEKNQIAPALTYFQYKLKGVSFLPRLEKTSYPQMPYEEITKEQYEQMTKRIKKLNFNGIKEDSKPELFCNNDTCMI